MFAEFIANDAPLVMTYKGELYFPVLFEYPETEFGGVFETEAEYLEPFVQDLIRDGDGWWVFPPIPFSYETIDLLYRGRGAGSAVDAASVGHRRHRAGCRRSHHLRVPSFRPLRLGADLLQLPHRDRRGRDPRVFRRRHRPVRPTAGRGLGRAAAVLFLIIILSSLIEPNPVALLLLLLLFNWMALVAVVRAECLRTRNFDYVRAARALGESDFVIMTKHLLPNAMVATLTYLPFLLSGSIVTTLTSLDFLGFGLPAGYPSLGELLAQGKANIQAPWLGLAGFFHAGRHADPVRFRGRGRARRIRSEAGYPMSDRILDVNDLAVAFRRRRGRPRRQFHISTAANRGARWRVGFRQIGHRAVGHAVAALSAGQPPPRLGPGRWRGGDRRGRGRDAENYAATASAWCSRNR